MKVEAAKNHSVENKETKSAFKTESSVFDTSSPQKLAETLPPPPSTSAFAKILEENRKHTDKETTAPAKNDSSEHETKASKSDNDQKVSRAADEKKELEERNSKNGDSDARQEADENQSPLIALAALQTQTNSVSEHNVPAARSILHIADLERIISTIRSETFQNQKQVTIALKNSVLEGLQIKLTITENGKLKAEFLAASEQIKKQLLQRKKELSEVLRNRSTLFSEVEITAQNQNEKE